MEPSTGLKFVFSEGQNAIPVSINFFWNIFNPDHTTTPTIDNTAKHALKNMTKKTTTTTTRTSKGKKNQRMKSSTSSTSLKSSSKSLSGISKQQVKEFEERLSALEPISTSLPPLSTTSFLNKKLTSPKSFDYAKNGFSNQLDFSIRKKDFEKKLKKISKEVMHACFEKN